MWDIRHANRDNTYNSISNTEKNYNYNNNFYTKQFPNKGIKNYLDTEININNYSFDAPQKQLNSKVIKREFNYPSSYKTLNARKLTDNLISKYKYNINNNTIGKNVYKSKNINVNSQNPMNKKLKGY